MNIAFVPWEQKQLGDKLFEINGLYNRDNCMMIYKQMWDYVYNNGGILHTIDMFPTLREVDCIVFFTYNEYWYNKVLQEKAESKAVYVAFEPPVVERRHTKQGLKKLGKKFNTVFTWDDDLLNNINKKFMYPYYFEKKWGGMDASGKKLLVNISGNKTSKHKKELYSEREKVIRYFEKNDNFEIYGPGWESKNYKNYKGLADSKADVYHKFKFALCLENMKDVKGYITEKILDCFSFGIVPIYQGASNIDEYIPRDCYIDYSKFSSVQDLEKFLLDMPDSVYKGYIDNIQKFLESDKVKPFQATTFIDTITEDVRNGFSQGKNFECPIIVKTAFRIKYIVKSFFSKIIGKLRNIITKRRGKYELKRAGIEIGKNSVVDSNTHIAGYAYIGKNCTVTKALIGRYVSIGDNCSIGPGEHDLSCVSTSQYIYDEIDWYDKLTEKSVIIGNDVWIGVDSIIRRGVKIGNGAVIGANSFVNEDVPEFAVVAGNPARIIKYRFDEKMRKKISESGWWNEEPAKAKEIIRKLEEINHENIGS